MRESEFWVAVAAEFGDTYGNTVTRDLVLIEFGDLTAVQAMAAGHGPRAVWLALCAATDVPPSRRHGVGQLPKN
ncbi:DUF3046 domain-containing protein [Marisediminicola senii]|uniref:DUF3046 domain-containing protein n=1 Tax=Marisediminicola senii TaxID=2711233 RepID=UPI0013EA36F3|nr:DUF3046 domain-containing protein [Marisediminicola senii]